MEHRKAVIITGAASTLGKALVQHFAAAGWLVHGTSRSLPGEGDDFIVHPDVHYHRLNLENTSAIYELTESLTQQQPINLLINNAGFVLSGPFENCSDEQIRRQMEVNFFGSIFAIKAIIPAFKKQRYGTIINISSLCGRLTFPMLSMYHASKWAIEGFSESLKYELESFGITIKLVEPGGIKENNYTTSIEFASQPSDDYADMLNRVHHSNWFPSFTEPEEVARQVFDIAMANSSVLRHTIGDDCDVLLAERNAFFEGEAYIEKIKQRIAG